MNIFFFIISKYFSIWKYVKRKKFVQNFIIEDVVNTALKKNLKSFKKIY